MQNNNFNNINNNDKYAYGTYFMITNNSFDEKIIKQINKQTENVIFEINALSEKINSYLNDPDKYFQNDFIILLNKNETLKNSAFETDEEGNIKISPLNYYKYVIKRIISFMNKMTTIMPEYDYYINQKVDGDASLEKKFELLKAHFVIYKDLHDIIQKYTTKLHFYGGAYKMNAPREINNTNFENKFSKSLNSLYENLSGFENKIKQYKELTNLPKPEENFLLNNKNNTNAKMFEDNSYYDALKNYEKNPNSSYEKVVMPKIDNNIINNSNNIEKDSELPHENVITPKIDNNIINNSNNSEDFFEETNSNNSNLLNKKTERPVSQPINSNLNLLKFYEICGFKTFLFNVEGKILDFSYKNENLKRKMGYSLNLKEFEQEINELINEMKKIIASCFKKGEFDNSGKLTNKEAERKIDELKISIFTKFQNFEKPFNLIENSEKINLTDNNLSDNFDDYLFNNNNNNINNLKSTIKPSIKPFNEKEGENFSLNLDEFYSEDSNDLESSFSNLNKNNNSSNEFTETMNSIYDIYKISILTNEFIKNLNIDLKSKMLDFENRYNKLVKKAKKSLNYNEFKKDITKLNENIIKTFNKHFNSKESEKKIKKENKLDELDEKIKKEKVNKSDELDEKIKELETLLNNNKFEDLLKKLKKEQNKK